MVSQYSRFTEWRESVGNIGEKFMSIHDSCIIIFLRLSRQSSLEHPILFTLMFKINK